MRVADTYLPSISNFLAGKPAPLGPGSIEKAYWVCHVDAEGHQHCVYTCAWNEYPCDIP